jgi:L-aminopeptidase/D-esterase-like protein
MKPYAATIAAAAITLAAATVSAWAGQDALAIDTAITGPVLKFDWPTVEVGTATYEAGPTGVTVIRFPQRAVATVDVRGGAPGTYNTASLRLGYARKRLDAVVFAGGSSYGLEAIAGVATGLKDSGERNGANIAGVTGAIIYGFRGHRLNEIYPDKRLGQAALHAVRPGIFPLGTQGAGRMALQGWFFGCGAHSGEGAAFRQIGDTKIAAFVVINAYGSIVDRNGNIVRCHRAASWGKLTKISELLAHLPESHGRDWTPPAAPTGRNTTVSLIVTNRELGFAVLQRLAMQVHTSTARAIQPFSTFDGGDTLFAVSTGEIVGATPGLIDLDTIAGETIWDAILASVPQEPNFKPPTAPVTVPPAMLARYAGRYRFGPQAVITIEAENGKLSATLWGVTFFDLHADRQTALVPLSDTDFYVDGRYHTRIAFVLDASGKAAGAIVNPGRWRQVGTRIGD